MVLGPYMYRVSCMITAQDSYLNHMLAYNLMSSNDRNLYARFVPHMLIIIVQPPHTIVVWCRSYGSNVFVRFAMI